MCKNTEPQGSTDGMWEFYLQKEDDINYKRTFLECSPEKDNIENEPCRKVKVTGNDCRKDMSDENGKYWIPNES